MKQIPFQLEPLIRSRKFPVKSFTWSRKLTFISSTCWYLVVYLGAWNESWGECTWNSVIMLGACKLIASIVSHASSFNKNKTIPILSLTISIFISLLFPDGPWYFHSIVTIYLYDHTISLGFYHFLRNHCDEWDIRKPVDLYVFCVAPSLPELVATIYTTRSSRRSPLLALFRLPKYENIVKHLPFRTHKSKWKVIY